ncbi:MAG: sigma-54 dependent transcriptional regulator [Pseudomonadota bacterium]
MTDFIFDRDLAEEKAAELAPVCRALEARGLTHARTQEDATGPGTAGHSPCHTFVAPGDGEPAQLVAQAKALGARRIIALGTGVGRWTLSEELGGRLLRVHLPGQDAAAQLAFADLLAAPLLPVVAVDPAARALRGLAKRVALHDVSVFINGPTGSGKEVLSKYIHHCSKRSEAPFVALNCAAIPENMLEAMLFGHEKGAFTGAAGANKGYLRAADGGTLLLDEISEMPLALQAKLLRVLQEKVVTPLGTQKEIAVDIRILATSNRDMPQEIVAGRFREDLFFRLNVFPLESLPLSARRADIPALAQAFVRRHGPGPAPLLTASALDALATHDWPGNVRELENVIQRALVLSDGAPLEARHIMLTAAGAARALAEAA